MWGRLLLGIAKSPAVTSSLNKATGIAARTFSKEVSPGMTPTTHGVKNFFNAQRSCCPLKVCGTPGCPINKTIEKFNLPTLKT